MHFSPLHTSSLFSVPSNSHIVDTEYPKAMRLPIFAVRSFVELLLHPSTFLIKDFKSV